MRRIDPSKKKPQFYALASGAIVLALLYFAQEVLIPLALAVLFAFLLAPLVTRLERMRWGRWTVGRTASALIVVVAFIGVVVGFGWMLERRVVQIADDLPQYREGIRTKLRQFTRSGGVVEKMRDEIKQTVAESGATDGAAATQPSTKPVSAASAPGRSIGGLWPTTPQVIRPTPEDPWPVRLYPTPSSALEVGGEYVGRFLGPLATAGLVIVFVIFTLLAREDLRDRMMRLLGGGGRLHVTTAALNDAGKRVSRYLLAQSIINAAYGSFVAIGLWTIDVTIGGGRNGILTALLGGLLCGVLRFVPYIGAWVGAALPMALAFATYPGNGVFFATAGMFVVTELIVSQAVEPKLLGATTGISPMAVLVAAVFWTWLWGPVGLLLSAPLTVLLVVMGKYVPQLEYLAILLGDKPVLPRRTRIYQRLIAGDMNEATKLSLACLTEMPLEEVYDRVLLPALAESEADHHRGLLDQRRQAEMRERIRTIVGVLGETQAAKDAAAASAQTVRDAKGVETPVPADRVNTDEPDEPARIRVALPEGRSVHVLGIPAQGEADEIAVLMLAQLLTRRGFRVTSPPSKLLASEIVAFVEQQRPDVVVVSAMPPKAAPHARYVYRRLAGMASGTHVVVGLWVGGRELRKSGPAEFGGVRPVTRLSEAENRLDELTPQILAGPAKPEVKSGNLDAPSGNAGMLATH